MGPTTVTKLCSVCGIDVSQQKRTKDSKPTSKYPYITTKRLTKLFAACNVTKYKDLTEIGIKSALNKMKTSHGKRKRKSLEIASRTRGHIIFAVKRFCEWMMQTGRAGSNPTYLLKASSVPHHK